MLYAQRGQLILVNRVAAVLADGLDHLLEIGLLPVSIGMIGVHGGVSNEPGRKRSKKTNKNMYIEAFI